MVRLYTRQLLKLIWDVFKRNRTYITMLILGFITGTTLSMIFLLSLTFKNYYSAISLPVLSFIFIGIFGALSIGKTTKNLLEVITKSLIMGIVFSLVPMMCLAGSDCAVIAHTWLIFISLSVSGGVLRYGLRRL